MVYTTLVYLVNYEGIVSREICTNQYNDLYDAIDSILSELFILHNGICYKNYALNETVSPDTIERIRKHLMISKPIWKCNYTMLGSGIMVQLLEGYVDKFDLNIYHAKALDTF